jgi:uncharacterized protein (DUF1810 family)
MNEENDFKRFIDAQKADYDIAVSEIRRGSKQSHWMWYIFPQIQGLGFSEVSKYYAIKDLSEAQAFLKHAVLGNRLVGICNELLRLESNNAHRIFGSPDDLKLKSSMTLFASLPETNPVFQKVLDKFFGGSGDAKTLQLLGS